MTTHEDLLHAQISREDAIAIAESGIWKEWDNEQIVRFQLFQDKLCMPFSRFHEAMEDVLGRPVYTHEFAYSDSLKEEYLGTKKPPTLEDIIGLIPKEKLILVSIQQ